MAGNRKTASIGTSMRPWSVMGLPAALAILLSVPSQALAVLGETIEPAATSGTASRSTTGSTGNAVQRTTLGPTGRSAYSTHEKTNEAGTRVREYAGPDGKVFAVAWDGPAKPNLRQLLGAYFEEFAGTSSAQNGSHHKSAMDNGRLVVRSSAYLRNFSGVAFLPSAMPEGVSPEDLQ